MGDQLLNFHEIYKKLLMEFLTRAPKVLFIIILAWLAIRFVKAVSSQILKMSMKIDSESELSKGKRLKTLTAIIVNTASVVIYGSAIMMVLNETGINISPILAGASILGVAIGFGSQSLVKDIVTGFFIILEDQFRVGDSIKAANVAGEVEDINLRATSLRDADGTLHHIPNSQITVVSNMTRGWSRAIVDVDFDSAENIDRITNIIKSACAEIRADETFGKLLIDDFDIQNATAFKDSAVTVRIMVKTKPGKNSEINRETRKRIKEAFEKEGVVSAVAHRMIMIKED